jgi:hypothetical protein
MLEIANLHATAVGKPIRKGYEPRGERPTILRTVAAGLLLLGASPPVPQPVSESESDLPSIEAVSSAFEYRGCLQRHAIIQTYCSGERQPAVVEHAVRQCQLQRATFAGHWPELARNKPEWSAIGAEEAADRLKAGVRRDYSERIDLWLSLAKAPPDAINSSVCEDIDASD